MAKRSFALLVVLCLMIGLMPVQAYAAGSLLQVEVVDTAMDRGYTVWDENGTQREFAYTVPEGGATVLIFFSANCGNCSSFFYRLNNCGWLDDPNVNIVAVESQVCSAEGLRNFIDLNAYGSQRYIDYYYAADASLLYGYYRQVFSGNSITWPLVFVIDASGGENTIRYAGMGVMQPADIEGALRQLTDSAQPEDITNGALSVIYAKTAPDGIAPVVSYNDFSHNYTNEDGYGRAWADPIESVLAYEQGGYTRVEHIGDVIVVERYDQSFTLQSRKEIPVELPIFGGVYLCEDYNFLVCGDTNPEQSANTEVIRVVHYTKDWQRITAAHFMDINTTVPFDAGTVRFARSGDMLHIRTSHEMYADADGVNHQANLTISIRVSDMTDPELFSAMVYDAGYTSHSFNQFILADGYNVATVDHGDAYPRAVVLRTYVQHEGEATLSGTVDRADILPIAEVANHYHYNTTGVEVGGFEYSSSHYLVAGVTCDQSGGADQFNAQRNIFVTATPKDDVAQSTTEICYLTDYAEGSDVVVSNPHLVKVGSDEFCLLWTVKGLLHFCMLDGTGQQTTEVYSVAGALSDCDPIVVDGKVIWYVTGDSEYTSGIPAFYQLDLSELDSMPVTPPVHSHSYTPVVTQPTCTEGGYTTYTCTCGDSYVSDETSALGHDWDDGTVLREPTLMEDGLMVYRCTRCMLGREEPISYVAPGGVTRISGSDRCATAFAVANALKSQLGVSKFDAIIIANGNDFADALAGSYLAAVKNAPILLHRNGSMDANVEYVRQNLAPGGTVYILGGTAAIPDALLEALLDIYMSFTIHRLAGDNRFVTNAQILEEAGFNGGEVLVCNSHNFADALSASATGKPILLVNNTTGRLNMFQTSLLQSASNVRFTIIGGTAAVSDSLANTLSAYGPVDRVCGSNRESTSVEVAKRYFAAPDKIVLAYSRNFPDGLCGGPLAYAMGAPLILTNARVEAVAADYVRVNGIATGVVLGGTSALTDATARLVFGLTSDAMIPLQ